MLENEGLSGALAEAPERAAISATFFGDGAGRYPGKIEAAGMQNMSDRIGALGGRVAG